MPPKPKPKKQRTDVPFTLPGTPASVRTARRDAEITATTSTALVQDLRPMRQGAPRRDFELQLRNQYANPAAMLEATKAFDRIHLRPIAASTKSHHGVARRLWLIYFENLYGSMAAALKTLVVKALLPPLEQLKHFFHFAATTGRSRIGIQGRKGWTLRTTQNFVNTVFAMRTRHHTKAAEKEDRLQIMAAVSEWAYVDHAIGTERLPKRVVRETDFEEFLIACLKPGLAIATNYMRLTLMSFGAFLYQHGSRPGSLVDAAQYEGKGEHLKWGDSEWVVSGWDEGAGLAIQSFWTFQWMKGQRFDKGKFVSTSMRNIGRLRTHKDAQLMLEALAIKHDIFVEDLVELRQTDPRTLKLPLLLTLKPGAANKPVWHLADEKTACTLSSMTNMLVKVRNYLGWSHFTFRSLRYAFAGAMAGRIPSVHLKYLMGHAYSSNLAYTTYQAPDRPVDVSGSRFNEGNVQDISDLHSSVAWKRTDTGFTASITEEVLKSDEAMKGLLAELYSWETAVNKKFGCTSKEVPDAQQGDCNGHGQRL
ncbi:hypothetical protein FPV67DRAFT_1739796 [Lyophyllum atratum]|nr:hypothetical protein FPV67DRAFT_1739796 [Lyophyllum atratum]